MNDEPPTRLDVRVVPRAHRDEVGGERDGRLVIRTTAPPVEGAANKAVRRVLAKHFGVAPRDIEIVRGQRSRDKTVEIRRPG